MNKFIFKNQEYQLYGITKQALENYRSKVKRNSNKTEEECRMKLTRNILCSKSNRFDKKGRKVYFYGNLQIFVDESNHMIVNVRNKKYNRGWRVDRATREGLDNMLFRDGLSKVQYRKFVKGDK